MHLRLRRALGTLAATALVGAGIVALDVQPAQAAYPVPPTPSGLTASIEASQPYIGQSTCDPTAKPGVSAFRDLLLKTYTDSGSFGIVRDCGAGGQSEHKEGRAFDWKMSASSTRQAGEVSALLSWLLKTDQYGNTAAMARRFGIMYMIWNHKIWKAYDPRWQAYSGASAHTDHVHFSFGWNGARKWTSYWDGTVAPIDFGPNGPPHITPVRSVANIKIIRDNGGTTLAMHSEGAAVSLLQKYLKVSPVDGDFGSDTATHVMKFQVDQGLPMTQRFGPTEWRKLFPFPIAPFGALDTTTYVLGSAVVRGWAIDADTTAPLEVRATVDGTLVEAVPAVLPRDDVGDDYPEYGAEHGFSLLLPVVDGTHQVCVTAANAVGTPGTDTQLGCRTISAQHDPVGALSSLTSSLGTVRVTGWAVDPDYSEPLTTSLTVDGAPSDVQPASVLREDIARMFPGVSEMQGVSAGLTLPDGSHTVCLLAPNADGTDGADAALGCKTVTVEHTPVGALEVVRRAPTGVYAQGWALDTDVASPVTVDITSDGAVVSTLTASRTRTDLSKTYPAQGADRGFAVVIDLPVGTHSVCAVIHDAAGTDGVDKKLPCRTVVVTHDGTGVKRDVRTIPGGSVLVAGDAYDPDTLSAAAVTVLLDGKAVKTVTASSYSKAAGDRWPGYGYSHGFSTTIAATRGWHTVCLRVANADGTLGKATTFGCTKLVVHDGVGAVTSWSRSSRTVTFRGWAVDPDTRSATRAALLVDGRNVTSLTADRYRSYLGTTTMPGYGTDHGVTFVRTLSAGRHTLCLVAQNASGTTGVARTVGCRTITVP